jgi:F-type H+-transporting ATPase subunit a
LIQAFIFALLTILYFSQSMELDHDGDDSKEHAKEEAHH